MQFQTTGLEDIKKFDLFNGDSIVYARNLTATERDRIDLEVNTSFKPGEPRTEEAVTRRKKMLYCLKAIQSWEGFTDEQGNTMPPDEEHIKFLFEYYDDIMSHLYDVISNQFAMIKLNKEKNFESGPNA